MKRDTQPWLGLACGLESAKSLVFALRAVKINILPQIANCILLTQCYTQDGWLVDGNNFDEGIKVLLTSLMGV